MAGRPIAPGRRCRQGLVRDTEGKPMLVVRIETTRHEATKIELTASD